MQWTSEVDRGNVHTSSSIKYLPVSRGAYLQDRRRALNLTQRDVARRAAPSLSLAYLQQLEQGRKVNPSIEIVVQLAAALEIDWMALAALVATRMAVKPRRVSNAIHVIGKSQFDQFAQAAQVCTLQDLHKAQYTTTTTRMLTLAIMAHDRMGLIFEVAAVLRQHHIDLYTCDAFDR